MAKAKKKEAAITREEMTDAIYAAIDAEKPSNDEMLIDEVRIAVVRWLAGTGRKWNDIKRIRFDSGRDEKPAVQLWRKPAVFGDPYQSETYGRQLDGTDDLWHNE